MTEQKKSFRQEMRDFDNQRDEDMRAIRESFASMQHSISDMSKYIRIFNWTCMAAIGAMVVTVIISLLRN